MTSKWPHSSGCGTILSSQNLAISHDTAVTSCAVLYAIWTRLGAHILLMALFWTHLDT